MGSLIAKRIYSVWVMLSMAFFFFLFIIPQLLCIPFRYLHPLVLRMNHLWAWGFLKLSFIPVKLDQRFLVKKDQRYILCANHFSYMDIPAMGLFPRPFKFVGKSQLEKIPLFGFVYQHIHITVNRSSYRSRARSLENARKAVSEGYNLGIFPEGGIRLSEFPKMAPFQDGAFRLAAECNVPVVPITFLDNHYILRDKHSFLFTPKLCRIVYHEPLWPHGVDNSSIRQFKEEVFRVIQNELDLHYVNVRNTVHC